MTTLADIAPRLARAHAAYRQATLIENHHRRLLTTKLLEVERLVAHRDLQLARAGWKNNRSYIAGRTRMLAAAQRAEARIRDQIADLDAWRRPHA